MEKGSVALDMIIITHQEAAEVSEPGKSAFDFPAMTVAAQFSAIVERGFAPPATMGTNQDHAALQQTPAQWIAVVSAIGHDAQGPLARAAALLRHANPGQSTFGQSHFPRRGRDQLASQRNTLAVDHHHPLRAFAALGFSNAVAPFLAGEKLPSRNDSLQSSRPCWSSSERKCRQILSQMSCSSHWRKRRQQVLGLGYSLGRSRQRAPVLSTQRMPSNTRRLSAHGRPRLRSWGRRGSSLAHCLSDKN